MPPSPTGHLNGTRVEEIIGLISRGGESVQFEIFRRLALAASFVVSRSRSPGVDFETFKRSLDPASAEALGKRARLIGFGVGRSDSPLDEMAYMLVAASLFARAGAEWIDPSHVQRIDRMIRAGESLLRSSAQTGAAREPGRSAAAGA